MTAEHHISMAQLIAEDEVNQLRTRYPEFLHPVHQLERMGAPFTRVIPFRIVDYRNLKLLSFSNYKSDFLPPYLKELTKLEHLNLQGTGIISPQEVIYHLPSLRLLAAHFYPDLARLPALTALYLSAVISESLPDFSHTPGLLSLGLTDCQLTNLPLSLTGLTQLQLLDLSGNCIEDVTELQYLTKLEKLHLINNKQLISEIPIGNSLKKLICDRDHLRLITYSPNQVDLLQLKHIECPGNPPLIWKKTPDGPTLSAFLSAYRIPSQRLA